MRCLVIAPHPDDELLGCGGTLLRRASEGAQLAWLSVTGISEMQGFSTEQVQRRLFEIEQVHQKIGFHKVYHLNLPTARLDTLSIQDLIKRIALVFQEFEPEEILVPHYSDVHTDHQIVFNAVSACMKWFRYPSVKRILSYETISETEFSFRQGTYFQPNFYVDITNFLDYKLEVLAIYQSEIDSFPFPRSLDALRALATFRGSTAGCKAAEAFQLLCERT